MNESVQAAVVVVPVHDEAALLERCLHSLAAALRPIDVVAEVRIVLDRCTDGSARIAERHPFAALRSEANTVGVARARGIASGLTALVGVPAERIWIANSDADSMVPANWLAMQLALADAGADVVVGTVRPDFGDLSAAHQRRWLDTHTSGAPNGHAHGANLGVRASTYLGAGGFREWPEHEDVHLVEVCRSLGATVVASDAAEVVTSGRLVGRTPGGYAGYLRDQERMLRQELSLFARRETS